LKNYNFCAYFLILFINAASATNYVCKWRAQNLFLPALAIKKKMFLALHQISATLSPLPAV
jgi:hypothetical protein